MIIFMPAYPYAKQKMIIFMSAYPYAEQHKAELDALADHIRDLEAQLRASHASRLSTGHCSPEAGLVFIDVLGAIEQIAYRSRKIADHMAGKKSAEA